MSQPLGVNDAILLLSLVYSCIDLSVEWELFDTCQRPIHRWLLVSYACVVAFRSAHLIGSRVSAPAVGQQGGSGANDGVGVPRTAGADSSAAVDFLLDLRQKGSFPKVLAAFSWLIALPFFILWTVVGSIWLLEVVRATPSCVPSTTHLWFAGFWLVLCYMWIIVHAALGGVAWMLERRVRHAERNLRAVEDDDMISRWGSVSTLDGHASLPAQEAGLSPQQIRALPQMVIGQGGDGAEHCSYDEDCECAICINGFRTGDNVRKLPVCGHTFHCSCIDLWLLRRADCPLCKRSVRCDGIA